MEAAVIGEERAAETAATSAAPVDGSAGDRMFTGHPVTLPIFEGPIDLLIYLVQQDEVDVFEVAIRVITSEYREWLAGAEGFDIEVAGEFVVMAAQLMEIKSRLLLPQPEVAEEEEEEAGDPRAALLAKLREYRRFRNIAEDLKLRADLQRWVFSRELLGEENGNGHPHEILLDTDMSSFDLWAAFQSVLSRVKEKRPDQEVVRPRFTVPQKMGMIATRVRWTEQGLDFMDLFEDDRTLVEVIVTFLALLELVRLHRVRVVQEQLFEAIRIYPQGLSKAA